MSTGSNEPVEFRAGDVIRLRKPHPCGGFEWTVLRIGGDIGLKCQTCGRRLMLPRRELERRLKSFISRGPEMIDGVFSGAPRSGE